jgi:cyclic beta-1,2-glucan synthetase
MYQAWVEDILGFKRRGSTLVVDPTIPGKWRSYTMRVRHGQALYEILVDNPDGVSTGVAWIELDGRRLESPAIPLQDELVKHRVVVRMGRGQDPAAVSA